MNIGQPAARGLALLEERRKTLERAVAQHGALVASLGAELQGVLRLLELGRVDAGLEALPVEYVLDGDAGTAEAVVEAPAAPAVEE